MTDEAPKRGFEEIDLDLSTVPTVEAGLTDAAERRQRFIEIAKSVIGAEPGQPIFLQHIPFVSFINRASSLHDGIVSLVRDENPHSVFTLLRAYLELVVLVLYVDAHPEYIKTLETPMAKLPKNTRKTFAQLFEFAAIEMAGVRHVYGVLNEMAHFGSTALYMPFRAGDDRVLTFSTGRHWKDPKDARIALAMLEECDDGILKVLERFAANHLLPVIDEHRRWNHAAQALAEALGGDQGDAPGEFATVSADVMAAAEKAGLVSRCEEHDVFELVKGVTPEQIASWARAEAEAEKSRSQEHVTDSQ